MLAPKEPLLSNDVLLEEVKKTQLKERMTMTRQFASTRAAGILLAAVFFAGGAAARGPRPRALDYKPIPKLQEIKDRPAAPDFTLPDPDGRKVSLKDFRGKVVFLNFWATWCESCRDEMPSMERLYGEFKGKGLEIVAVNVKEKPQERARVRQEATSSPTRS